MPTPRPEADRPSALGGYDDWPAWVHGRLPDDGHAPSGDGRVPSGDGRVPSGDDGAPAVPGLGHEVARALGLPAPTVPGAPPLRTLARWQADGVITQEVEWAVGFGPATRAWLLRPAAAPGTAAGAVPDAPLPGVLLLHCHAGIKSIGAERLVRTPAPTVLAERLRRELYDGRALAEDLARRGFVVLVHDTFAWGSRRFDLDPLPISLRGPMSWAEAAWAADGVAPDDHMRYDTAAGLHEHVVAKTAGTLGTSFAGMVAHDDLVALEVLRSAPGVDPSRTAAAGFSGGGGRAATLAGLDRGLRAAAVVAMMTTTDALLPAYADAHSWLLTTPGLLGRVGLPQIAAGRRAHDLLAVSFADDRLFPPDGVRDAHAELVQRYAAPGATGTVRGEILPGGHVFTAAAQDLVADFLHTALTVA